MEDASLDAREADLDHFSSNLEKQQFLRQRFWRLILPENFEEKAKLIPRPFLKQWVDPVANRMASAILTHVQGAQETFQKLGVDYLRKELGCIIVDGYLASYLYFCDSATEVNRFNLMPQAEQESLGQVVTNSAGNVKAADIVNQYPMLSELIDGLVEMELHQEGFNQ